MSELLLGVDGGGTKTCARVARLGPQGELCVLGTGRQAGSNPFSVGWELAQRRLLDAIDEAKRQAGVAEQPSAVALAVAGCATDTARDRLAAWAQTEAIALQSIVVPDTQPLLAEAPQGKPAVGLISGTGSSAIARAADGAETTLGGWGYLIDDGGSGFHLGRLALRQTIQRADEGAPIDSLARSVLLSLGVEHPQAIKQRVYQSDDPRRTIAQLCPALLRLAEQGNENAVDAVEEAAAALADLVRMAALRVCPDRSGSLRVYGAGSLLERSAYYRRRVEAGIVKHGVRLEGDRLRLAPDGACGCCRLAARAAGVTPEVAP